MLNLAVHLPAIVWTTWSFIVGACVGSLLNVVVARLPLEKSIVWPNSRCGWCLQPIRWRDNIPLISYWLLRGRCRQCGTRFSSRYFWLEFITAALFAGVFWIEVIANWRGSPFIQANVGQIRSGVIPLSVWAYILQRWTLIALLIVVSACDLQSREIPLSVTIGGTLIGVVFSIFMPWPWPEATSLIPAGNRPWWQLLPPASPPTGAQLWPFWGPSVPGFPNDSMQMGLATSIIGLLTGTWLLRAVRWLASRGLGREALGLGDADLMMMVGAFLGWQAVVVAFFVGALCALVIAVVQVVVFRDDSLPFGPGLAVGSLVTALCWHEIGPSIQVLLFNDQLLPIIVGFGGVMLFLLCWVMGRIRGAVSH